VRRDGQQLPAVAVSHAIQLGKAGDVCPRRVQDGVVAGGRRTLGRSGSDTGDGRQAVQRAERGREQSLCIGELANLVALDRLPAELPTGQSVYAGVHRVETTARSG
jgi:hypothetical protein